MVASPTGKIREFDLVSGVVTLTAAFVVQFATFLNTFVSLASGPLRAITDSMPYVSAYAVVMHRVKFERVNILFSLVLLLQTVSLFYNLITLFLHCASDIVWILTVAVRAVTD